MGLREYGLQMVGDVKLYPTEYFYPFPWRGRYHPDRLEENAYCIHHWQMSRKKKGFPDWFTKIKWRLLDPLLTSYEATQADRCELIPSFSGLGLSVGTIGRSHTPFECDPTT